MAPDAFFCNPAGTAYLSRGASSVLIGYESLLEGAGRTAIAGLKGLSHGAVGLGALYRYESGLKKYDIYGDSAGGFEAYDAAFIGSYGARFESLDAGLAVKYIRSKLYDRSAGSAALDLGVIIKGVENGGTDLAFFARNFGQTLKLGSESAPLPFEFGGALNWRLIPRLNFFIDGRLPSDHSPYLITAGEYAIPFAAAPKTSAVTPDYGAAVRSGLFLRGGLNFKNKEDLGWMGAFSAGFGVKFRETSFDYAFVPYGDLGVTHRFTLGWGFGTGASAAAPVDVGGRFGARVEKLSLAVAAFEPGDGVSDTLARQVSDMLEAELVKTGVFRLVERTEMGFILAEKKIDYSGLSQKDGAAGLARLVGARAALFGGVSKREHGYLITLSMVDSETGKILSSDSRVVEEDYLFKQAARDLALKLSAR